MSTRIEEIGSPVLPTPAQVRAPRAPENTSNIVAPEPPTVDMVHGDAAPGPVLQAAADPASRGGTSAERLHNAVEALEEGPRAEPEHVRRARALQEKAGTVFGQGVPPLQLDPDRAHEATDLDDEETSGEARLRVKPTLGRNRRRHLLPRVKRRSRAKPQS